MTTLARISEKGKHVFAGLNLGCQVRKFCASLTQKSAPKLSSDKDSCFILTYYGKMRYSADRLISLDEFFNDVPLFDKVRTDRLIETVDSEKPYCMHDRATKLLRTGVLPLYICKQLGLSIPRAFRASNVGVLKGMDVLAFKELDVQELSTATEATESNGYDQFLHFFKDLVCRYVCPEALSQMPGGFGRLMKVLEMPDVNDEDVVYNAAFWPKLLVATMFFEFHRLLREEFPARGLGHKAMKILEAIDQHHPHFMNQCAGNELLVSWAGVHSKRSGLMLKDLQNPSSEPKESTDDMKTPPEARVVDTHRHGVVHAINFDNVDLADRLPEVNQTSLEDEPYELEDIIDLFTYKFPEYPTICVTEFSNYCLWYKLQLRKRFPIPSIFCPSIQ